MLSVFLILFYLAGFSCNAFFWLAWCGPIFVWAIQVLLVFALDSLAVVVDVLGIAFWVCLRCWGVLGMTSEGSVGVVGPVWHLHMRQPWIAVLLYFWHFYSIRICSWYFWISEFGNHQFGVLEAVQTIVVRFIVLSFARWQLLILGWSVFAAGPRQCFFELPSCVDLIILGEIVWILI